MWRIIVSAGKFQNKTLKINPDLNGIVDTYVFNCRVVKKKKKSCKKKKKRLKFLLLLT